MPVDVCRLCGETALLQESHVIPKFIFRWAKETSATGYFRFGESPNKRQQDGPKQYWLCTACEARLNEFETPFANQVFLPFCNGDTSTVRYGTWMLKFAVSLSWRAMLFIKEHQGFDHLLEAHLKSLDEATKSWKAFLLGLAPHPGAFEQHLLPVEGLSGFSGAWPPANINRYLMRSFEMDVVMTSPAGCFVYTKIPRFIFLGFVSIDRPRRWMGTKLHLKEGEVRPRTYNLPEKFIDYLIGRAKRFEDTRGEISESQLARIRESVDTDPYRAANSDAFRALRWDVEMFGKDKVFSERNDLENSKGELE